MQVKLTEISDADAYCEDSGVLVGQIGELDEETAHYWGDGWISCNIDFANDFGVSLHTGPVFYFHEVKFEVL